MTTISPLRAVPSRRAQAGISTAEVLVGSALSLMLLTAMYSTFQVQTRAFATQSAYSQSQNVTRTLLDLMTREMRMIAYDPTDAAIPDTVGDCAGEKWGIVQASPTLVQFRQDLNGDGDVLDDSELVTYQLQGGTIERQDGANAAVVLVENVPSDGLQFRYFDMMHPPNEMVPVGTLTQNQMNCVSKIEITARAEVAHPDPRVHQPVVSRARSEIAIRNRSLQNF